MIDLFFSESVTEAPTPVFDNFFGFLGFGSIDDFFLTFLFSLLLLALFAIVVVFIGWVFEKIDDLIMYHKSNVDYNRLKLTYEKNKLLKSSEDGDNNAQNQRMV